MALLVKKGGTVHRRSGLLFVYAMFVLGISAAILGKVVGGLMTVYCVGTALTTVHPVSPWNAGPMLPRWRSRSDLRSSTSRAA